MSCTLGSGELHPKSSSVGVTMMSGVFTSGGLSLRSPVSAGVPPNVCGEIQMGISLSHGETSLPNVKDGLAFFKAVASNGCRSRSFDVVVLSGKICFGGALLGRWTSVLMEMPRGLGFAVF